MARLLVASLALTIGTSSASNGGHPGLSSFSFRTAQEEFNAQLFAEGTEKVKVNGGEDADAALEFIDSVYIEDVYLQHNPYTPNGRQAVADTFVNNRGNFTYEIGAIFAEGDYVATHFRAVGVEPVPYIGIDIVKIVDGKFVEHWDVHQAEIPASQSVSGNAMWPIEFPPQGPSPNEARNRYVVYHAVNQLFNFRNTDVVDEFFAEDYIQHNAFGPNGREYLKSDDFIALLADVDYEFGLTMAYGDYVFVHFRAASPLVDVAQIGVDIFRLEDGVIAEHWDVVTQEVSRLDSVNGNAMFPVN